MNKNKGHYIGYAKDFTKVRAIEAERKAALGVADQVEGLVLEVQAKAGEEGKLYGSVTNIDIEKLLSEKSAAAAFTMHIYTQRLSFF